MDIWVWPSTFGGLHLELVPALTGLHVLTWGSGHSVSFASLTLFFTLFVYHRACMA